MSDTNGGSANIPIIIIAIIAGVFISVVAALIFVHFLLGVDIPFVNIVQAHSAAHWGQIGDFVGGILNPLLSFLALIAVLLSLRSQAAELKAARAEAKTALGIQDRQTAIFDKQSILIERQSFESSFYGLLEMKSRIIDSLRVSGMSLTGPMPEGPACLKYFINRYHADRVNYKNPTLELMDFEESCRAFVKVAGDDVGHYFQFIIGIFDYVDSYRRFFGLSVGDTVSLKLNDGDGARVRRFYSEVATSSMSGLEVEILFLYMVGSGDERLKNLAAQFDIFGRLPSRAAYDKFNLKALILGGV